jgi:alpha-amylase/alpha-mannosidase (GH57 family)
LREALDWLRDRLNEVYEREASEVLKDSRAARNEYIKVILRRNDDTVRKFLKDHCQKVTDPSR